MTIQKAFKPTFLYIKRHSKTGLLYFGKTVRPDPSIYQGSGLYWGRHCKKHGWEHVETLWFCLFNDRESLNEFAVSFSNINNIVESKEWANMIPENGFDGKPAGLKASDETRRRIGLKSKGRKWTDASRQNIKGRKASDETKKAISQAQSGENNHFFGKTHNDKALASIKEARAKQVITPEQKERTRLSMLAYHQRRREALELRIVSSSVSSAEFLQAACKPC